MSSDRRLLGWLLALAMLPAAVAPLAQAADGDEFPVPQSSKFT